jgi:hypothetical protein
MTPDVASVFSFLVPYETYSKANTTKSGAASSRVLALTQITMSSSLRGTLLLTSACDIQQHFGK